MDRPLFSTYSTDENRVSGSLMAVLERLSLGTLESLLSAATEEDLSLLGFRTQPSNPHGNSIPDGVIESSVLLLFEFKIQPGSIEPVQLREHLRWLDASQATTRRLIYVTPDASRPHRLQEVGDHQHLVWTSYKMLDDAITDVLAEPVDLVSERERFLLREVADMFRQEGLVGGFDTVVVAGRVSWPEYNQFGIYACQAQRSFRAVPYLGFYVDKTIQPKLAKRVHWMPEVTFDDKTAAVLSQSDHPHERRVGAAIPTILRSTERGPREAFGVMVLTPPDHEETLVIEPVAHRAPGAWTQSQRYTSSELLRQGPADTDELAEWEKAHGLR